jgi:magnesium chelatase subunit D
MTPTLVMLSDGRANVTLQGEGSRPIAKAQCLSWAQQWRASFINAIWLDTSARPDPQGQDIAQAMGAHYVPLPLAGSQRMASTVQAIQELQS